jgi:hypothetical protein
VEDLVIECDRASDLNSPLVVHQQVVAHDIPLGAAGYIYAARARVRVVDRLVVLDHVVAGAGHLDAVMVGTLGRHVLPDGVPAAAHSQPDARLPIAPDEKPLDQVAVGVSQLEAGTLDGNEGSRRTWEGGGDVLSVEHHLAGLPFREQPEFVLLDNDPLDVSACADENRRTRLRRGNGGLDGGKVRIRTVASVIIDNQSARPSRVR